VFQKPARCRCFSAFASIAQTIRKHQQETIAHGFLTLFQEPAR
jgi:hypothetical protein